MWVSWGCREGADSGVRIGCGRWMIGCLVWSVRLCRMGGVTAWSQSWWEIGPPRIWGPPGRKEMSFLFYLGMRLFLMV